MTQQAWTQQVGEASQLCFDPTAHERQRKCPKLYLRYAAQYGVSGLCTVNCLYKEVNCYLLYFA